MGEMVGNEIRGSQSQIINDFPERDERTVWTSEDAMGMGMSDNSICSGTGRDGERWRGNGV